MAKDNKQTSVTEDTATTDTQSTETSTESVVQKAPAEPVVEVVETKPAEPIKPEPVVVKTDEVIMSDFQKLIAKIKQSGTAAQMRLVSSIERYINEMAPGKPIGRDEGAKEQYYFWKAISSVIEQSPSDEFKKLWNILLAFYVEYKDDVFADRYVFRFSEYWTWSQKELNAFQRILNLIKLTANQETRAKGLKEVNLDKTLAEGFSDEGRQRIVMFYKG